MERQIATNRLQSDRLLKCGVPAESADMCFINGTLTLESYSEANSPIDGFMHNYEVAPAFSLGCLLSLLPTSLLGPTGNEYMLELSKLRMHCAWEVQWWNGRSRFTTYDKKKKFHKLWDKFPIEACVKAIEWLTERGYKLNGIEKGGSEHGED